jgi:hypothetical protein
MSELYDLFHILPIDDACSCLCIDKLGKYKHTPKSKFSSFSGDKLIFTTYQDAQNYINRYLNTDLYKVGPFAGNKDLYMSARRDTSVSFIDGHTEG